MAVISVRLNPEEEKMMELLAAHYEEDKSALIKHSLREMFEDLVDNKVIEEFESREKKGRRFVDAKEILNSIKAEPTSR